LQRGHHFVAEDMITLQAVNGRLLAQSAVPGDARQAIRGLGILDVRRHLGAAVHPGPVTLSWRVELRDAPPAVLPEPDHTELLGIGMPTLTLPRYSQDVDLIELSCRVGHAGLRQWRVAT
ncbi:MAG: hypothetical protein ABF296_12615, partial [Oceanococcaceae bacterium]